MARLSTPPTRSPVKVVNSMETVLIDYRTTTNPAVEHIAAMLMAHDYRVSVYNVDDDPDGSVIKDLDERDFPYDEVRQHYGEDPIDYWAREVPKEGDLKYAIVDNFNDATKFKCPTLVVGFND
nr:MAG TPA: hypothetical protein [Caudoviricetes sp.]